MRTTQVIKGEMSAKTTYQRSAKGPVSISECSADGKYISLENTGRKVSLQKSLVFKLSLVVISNTVGSLDQQFA